MKNEYSKKYLSSRRAELDVAYNAIKPDWQELSDYFLPRSVRFLARNTNKQLIKNRKIKDSTPLIAVRNFSSGMMSGATNPATNWFRVKVRNYEKNTDYEVKTWCSSVETIFRDIFNFDHISSFMLFVLLQVVQINYYIAHEECQEKKIENLISIL